MSRLLKTKEEIYEAFPKVFPNRILYFGDGWNNLIWDACSYLQGVMDANIEWNPKHYAQFIIYDSKEKFGGLRLSVWFSGEHDPTLTENEKQNLQQWCAKVQHVFDYVEDLSDITCEITGEYGEPHYSAPTGGWVKTLSPEAAKQLNYHKLQKDV